MQRFGALDGFRGLFALAVALYHLQFASHLYADPILRQAYLCVDFFFVLSGFVISHAYGARLGNWDAVGQFVIRRFGRLWPLHVSMLAVFVLFEVMRTVLGAGNAVAFEQSHSIDALVANLFLVHSLYPYETFTWNVPSWSISAEFIVYLVFALVTLVFVRHRVLAALVIVAISAALCVSLSSGMDLTAHMGAVRACFGFFAGHLASLAYRRFGPVNTGGLLRSSLVELAVVGGVLVYVASVADAWPGYFAPIVFAGVVYLFAEGKGIVAKFMRGRPLQLLGTISYSVYLVHYILVIVAALMARGLEQATGQTLIFKASVLYGPGLLPADSGALLVRWGSDWAMDGLTLVYLAIVIGLAALTWRYIEMPGQLVFGRLAERWAHRRAMPQSA